jgi:hypothetical protein
MDAACSDTRAVATLASYNKVMISGDEREKCVR